MWPMALLAGLLSVFSLLGSVIIIIWAQMIEMASFLVGLILVCGVLAIVDTWERRKKNRD